MTWFGELWESLNPTRLGLATSGRWLSIVNVLCLVGVLASAIALDIHRRQHVRAKATGRDEGGRNVAALFSVLVLVAANVTFAFSIWARYKEVNHFPSQTMSEVVAMFSWGLLVSLLMLHFALGLRRLGPAGPPWATRSASSSS